MPFTPLPVGTVSIQDFNYEGEKSTGGGKIKGKSTRVHEHAYQQRSNPLPRELPLFAPKELVPASKESQSSVSKEMPAFTNVRARMDYNDSVPTKFHFSKAWPASLYDPETPNLPNGHPEEDEFWKTLFAVNTDATAFKTSSVPRPNTPRLTGTPIEPAT